MSNPMEVILFDVVCQTKDCPHYDEVVNAISFDVAEAVDKDLFAEQWRPQDEAPCDGCFQNNFVLEDHLEYN